MITLLYTFWLFVTVKTSDFDLQVKTVKIGENVTLKCDQIKDKQYSLAWFKQSFGKMPQLIVRAADLNERFGPAFEQRFRLPSNEAKFDLKIINTAEEDAGTYFCVKVKDNVVDFGSGTLLLFSGEKTQKRSLTEINVKSGKSVTLQCSVQSLSCSGDHSVYWFRRDSGEHQPGIIFTHGDSRSDQCKKSSETASPTQSCVYKLPKNNLSLSDAGTYYCAVAACGEILFGNGTKLHVNVSEINIWIFAALSTFSVICVIVIVVLAVLLLKKQQKGSFNDHPVHTDQAEATDTMNYAALNFQKKPPPTRTPRAKQTEAIYSQVRVQ